MTPIQGHPPTIGRIVHYTLAGDDLAEGLNAGEARAAIVTAVYDDQAVDLTAFLTAADGALDGSVALLLHRANVPTATATATAAGGEPGAWHWPPRV